MNSDQDLLIEEIPSITETAWVSALVDRILRYLYTGLPVALMGPAGIGKTTLALHAAVRLKRPVILVQGSEAMTVEHLLGGINGYARRETVDNYVRSVTKKRESFYGEWQVEWLTRACREGYVVVYDEFTRTPTEVNNILLPVLEERQLLFPTRIAGKLNVPVHPDFRILFTGNTEDYAGVYPAQSALLDRMVRIHVEGYDTATEEAIVRSRTGLDPGRTRKVLELVHAARHTGRLSSSLRPALLMGRLLAGTALEPSLGDPLFRQIAEDLLGRAVVEALPTTAASG